MTLQENYKLQNQTEILKIGLGTWLIKNDEVVDAVKHALEIGYRHIDTAQAYQNEAGVGKGIRESGVKREEIFVTTKLAAELKSYQKAVGAIDQSLKKLGMEYIDLMIIHSPQSWSEFGENDRYFEGNREAWRALEEAYEQGKLKSIGLSNFKKENVDNILDACYVKPMVNQILCHIRNTPTDLIDHCKEHDILVEAYSPLGSGVLLDNEQLAEMAKKYEVSVTQLCIRYLLELDLLPLPKSSDPEHIRSNTKVDFTISKEDMEVLTNIEPIEDYGEAGRFAVFRN